MTMEPKTKPRHPEKVNKLISPIKKKPEWIRSKIIDSQNFFKTKEKKPIMLENLRNIFYRMELSTKEIRILSGVFASLGKKR